MTRIFGRGELKAAVLDALAIVEPTNGYALMQTLGDQVGGGWRPSPGAIYPALLALEDDGLIESSEGDGSRLYRLSVKGRRERAPGTLDRVAARVRSAPSPAPTLGALTDDFAARLPGRGRSLDPGATRAVSAVLASARTSLTAILDKEYPDG